MSVIIHIRGDDIVAGKSNRVLELYAELMSGRTINKPEETERCGVSVKSIQRDIEEFRAFLSERAARGEAEQELVYDPKRNCYYLSRSSEDVLTNSEILAVCKILLESRAFCKDELEPIISKLIRGTVSGKDLRIVRELISNELFHYIPPRHGSHFSKSLWQIG